MNQTRHTLIRAVYLYIFSLLGLVLLTIGGVRFVDMGLKAFVFIKADEEQRIYFRQAPFPTVPLEKITVRKDDGTLEQKEGGITLTREEKTAITVWLENYNKWEKQRAEIDPVTSRRHRDASMNLAFILIGLPLYLYHWSVIKKEAK